MEMKVWAMQGSDPPSVLFLVGVYTGMIGLSGFRRFGP